MQEEGETDLNVY